MEPDPWLVAVAVDAAVAAAVVVVAVAVAVAVARHSEVLGDGGDSGDRSHTGSSSLHIRCEPDMNWTTRDMWMMGTVLGAGGRYAP